MFSKEDFGVRLKSLRTQKKLYQKDVVSELSITKQALSLLEKGKTPPTIETLIALADFFDVSLDYLVGRSDDPARINTDLDPDSREELNKFLQYLKTRKYID